MPSVVLLSMAVAVPAANKAPSGSGEFTPRWVTLKRTGWKLEQFVRTQGSGRSAGAIKAVFGEADMLGAARRGIADAASGVQGGMLLPGWECLLTFPSTPTPSTLIETGNICQRLSYPSSLMLLECLPACPRRQ